MKMDDIKVADVYAVKNRSRSTSAKAVKIEGFENFNPTLLKVRVIEKDQTRVVGFDFEKQTNKVRKGYVRVLRSDRDGNFHPKDGYFTTIPVANIVTLWSVYEETLVKYEAAYEKHWNKIKQSRAKASKHLETLVKNISAGAKLDKNAGISSYIPHYFKDTQVESYLSQGNITLDYKTALVVAEALKGQKIDVPVLV